MSNAPISHPAERWRKLQPTHPTASTAKRKVIGLSNAGTIHQPTEDGPTLTWKGYLSDATIAEANTTVPKIALWCQPHLPQSIQSTERASGGLIVMQWRHANKDEAEKRENVMHINEAVAAQSRSRKIHQTIKERETSPALSTGPIF